MVIATSYLAARGATVDVEPKLAADLAARIKSGEVDVRQAADEMREWIAG
jgi:hypothetical protein